MAILNFSIIISGSEDKTIKVWNSSSFQLITTSFGHFGIITALAILPDSTLLSTSIDGTLRKWIIPKITIGTWHIHRIYENLKGFSALAILPNSNIVSGSGDFTIKIWRSEYPYNFIATLTGHTNYVFALAILNNSNKRLIES